MSPPRTSIAASNLFTSSTVSPKAYSSARWAWVQRTSTASPGANFLVSGPPLGLWPRPPRNLHPVGTSTADHPLQGMSPTDQDRKRNLRRHKTRVSNVPPRTDLETLTDALTTCWWRLTCLLDHSDCSRRGGTLAETSKSSSEDIFFV